jgi:hypothetical protein
MYSDASGTIPVSGIQMAVRFVACVIISAVVSVHTQLTCICFPCTWLCCTC